MVRPRPSAPDPDREKKRAGGGAGRDFSRRRGFGHWPIVQRMAHFPADARSLATTAATSGGVGWLSEQES